MSDVTNTQRAQWARAALEAFDAKVFVGKADDVEALVTRIGDLICDLLHLARLEGGLTDPQGLVDAAVRDHDVEQAEDRDR